MASRCAFSWGGGVLLTGVPHYIDVQTCRFLEAQKCMCWVGGTNRERNREGHRRKRSQQTDRTGAHAPGAPASQNEQKHNTRRTDSGTKGGPRQQTKTNTDERAQATRRCLRPTQRQKQTSANAKTKRNRRQAETCIHTQLTQKKGWEAC